MSNQPIMPNSLPLLISFSGIDGAGKSTQIERLCASLSDSGLSVMRLEFWNDVVAFSGMRAGFSHKFLHSEGGVGAPDKPVQRNDKNTQSWYLNLSRSILYLFDAINLRRVFNRVSKSGAQVIVFDRFIYDQLATLPVQSAWAAAYVTMILKIAPKPDVAYVLDAMPEAARARKPEYPVDFLYKYRRSYLQLCDMAGLTLIDPMPKDDVHEAIKSKLAKYGVFQPQHQQQDLAQLTSI